MAGLTSSLIVGGLGLVGGAMGANAQERAGRDAANAQLTASREATQLQREQYYDTRGLMAPSIQAGAEAQARQMLMQGFSPEEVKAFLSSTAGALGSGAGGVNGTGMASAQDLQARYPQLYQEWSDPGTDGIPGNMRRTPNFGDFARARGYDVGPRGTQGGGAGGGAGGSNPDYGWVDNWSYEASSPSYAFRLGEGQKALERSAAARGALFSGATGKALTRYGQGFASQEFENDFNRLGALSGRGTQAAGVTVNAGQNYASQAGQNIMAGGAARASGYLAGGNAWGNFWGNTVPGAIGTIAGAKGWWG